VTSLLTDNFEIIASSPNGVKKIRELILQLAVMGRLVPQDPRDEPASKLQDRILRLKENGPCPKGKQTKGRQNGEFAEASGNIPSNWIWTNLESITYINPRNSAPDKARASFVPMTLIGTTFNGRHDHQERAWEDIKQGFTHFANGDIGIAKITPCFENSKACVFENLVNGIGAGTTELHIVRPLMDTLNPLYVLAYVKAPMFLKVGETKMTGTAGQKRLPKQFVQYNPFPLAPRAEQDRIVAKIDELMDLCDELESHQLNDQASHTLLLESLLNALLDAKNHVDYERGWNLVMQNFDVLFTTEASVDALKRTILKLSMMGKLVAPGERVTAAEQYTRKEVLDARRAAWSALHQKKNDTREKKYGDPIASAKVWEAVPEGWLPVTVEEITSLVTDGKHGDCRNEDNSGYFFLSVKDVYNGSLNYDRARQITKSDFDEVHRRTSLQVGDVLLTNTGATIGRVAVASDPERTAKTTFQKSVAVLKPVRKIISPYFLALSLEAGVSDIKDRASGSAVPNLLLRDIRSFSILVPPLAVQEKIVSRVNDLMGLCESLKTHVREARIQKNFVSLALIESGLSRTKSACDGPTNSENIVAV